MRFSILAVMAATQLVGCDVTKTDFPVRTASVQTEVEKLATNVAIVRLTDNNVRAFSEPRDLGGGRTTMSSANWDYKVGVGDVLDIVVWDHPELTNPVGELRSPEESGQRVQADGSFFYPYVGQVQAKGLTPEQIRDDLSVRLADYIPDPQVQVRVASYRSQAVSVTGEVEKPSRHPLTDMPLTLLDAIDAAGGLTEDADPRAVIVRRSGKSFVVDLQAFLEKGVESNNPVLKAGDVVSVQKLELQEAYLLGQVMKPSTIDLTQENVTLTQALTRVGGLKESSADARGVFVFRRTPMGVTVYQLDASSAVAYLIGTQFVIQPQDVIYVTASPTHQWNSLISDLLPTLTTITAADDLALN